MEYVYILQSERNSRYYIGSTNNLERRLLEHNSGHTKSLRNLLPMILVFNQGYEKIGEARKMELRLKRLKSRIIIESIIRDKIIKLGL
ncbi:MAG: GIY-YIG nuclease family protein [Candidatus Pacebacteria bacterium]|nr:GIY-YIG nuclease family protein [Candidatus Paceibacterota bacterium]